MTNSSRHQVSPFAGFKEVTALGVHTISCLFPPELMTAGELKECGIADANRAFNLSWHDWLNLNSLVDTSRVIAEAALARTDSRGAHYREDFPETGALDQSTYTSARLKDSVLNIDMKPVAFTRVRPGESLLGANAQSVGDV